MCLKVIHTEKTKQRWIKKYASYGYLRLRKAVVIDGGGRRFKPPFAYGPYRNGLNVACFNSSGKLQETNKSDNLWGLGAYLDSAALEKWWKRWGWKSARTTIEVLIAPEWVKHVGLSVGGASVPVIIASKMFFPTYPSTKPKVKDFRAALKKDRGK